MSLTEYYSSLKKYLGNGLTNPVEVLKYQLEIIGPLKIKEFNGERIVFKDTTETKKILKEEAVFLRQYKSNILFRFNHALHEFYKNHRSYISFLIHGENDKEFSNIRRLMEKDVMNEYA